MLFNGYKCDICKKWIHAGFEFQGVSTISCDSRSPLKFVTGELVGSVDQTHLCKDCAFHALFPDIKLRFERLDYESRGGPLDR